LAAITEAERRGGRPAGSVRLLPVSKAQTAARIAEVLAHPGLPRRLGENYMDEFLAKQAAPELVGLAVEWHFIGRLQSRKVLELAATADVIHTVSRLKELELLARSPRVPGFLLQVNTSGAPQKGGCEPGELAPLVEQVERLGLRPRLRGLMTIPAPLEDIGEAALRAEFARLRELRDRWVAGGELSMGMSGDFELAIAEGADWVRIGSALFGSRTY
jgi:pyridoxal phosphate enzyme (YggS family)